MDFFSPRLVWTKVSQIDDNLYLSSVESALDLKLLESMKIKRILTLETQPLDKKLPDITYMFIRAMDHPMEDLLSRFEECYQFISEGILKGDKVLVHCMAGVSRSATIVISYIMIKNNMSAEEAIAFVSKKRSIIGPNGGFKSQLRLFAKMNRKLDPMNTEFRKFLVKHLKYKIMISQPWFNSSYDNTCEPLDNYFRKLRDLMNESNINHRREETYKCKKCRLYLFNELNVIKNCDKSEQNVCDSLYVEPLNWMTEYIGKQANGSINCPNCLSKLGHYNWHLYVCQCSQHNELDCLLFKIDTKKVDSPYIQKFSTTL